MERVGKRLAAEQAFGRKDHDGRVKHHADGLRAVRIKRWSWPRWYRLPRRITISIHYYDEAGRRVYMPWELQ
jgi:hypothetical protein